MLISTLFITFSSVFLISLTLIELCSLGYPIQEKLTHSKSDKLCLSDETAWVPNGVAICTAEDIQNEIRICSDGFGGAIIVWHEWRNKYVTSTDIYAQKINSTGHIQWTLNGTPVCTATHHQTLPALCTDGEGGAIIVYEDARHGGIVNLYAQRINVSGNGHWTTNGMPICIQDRWQTFAEICSDGNGGAIMTWRDGRNILTTDMDIYAQRVNSTGNIQWTFNGIPITTENKPQVFPKICSDESGGAIITWDDHRDSELTSTDIYAQKVDINGIEKWTLNGTAITTEIEIQNDPKICNDGLGGAIITWKDNRSGIDYDIYAQRIDFNGSIMWTPNGTAISTANNDQTLQQICSDGAGGAIITWHDYRNGNWDIYAQRIDSNGNIMWTPNGKSICTRSDNQVNPEICSDETGGAIITWCDERNLGSTGLDIYAQRVDSNGAIQYNTNGMAICTADNVQRYAEICSAGNGDAFIVWQDQRSDPNGDLYAQITNYVPSDGPSDGIPGISFGNYYILYITVAILSLIIIKKSQIHSKSDYST
ncbi:MAG: hypothetical protein ACFFDN_19855 [Candidatus Hodarchaeota archaeon]